MKQADYILDSTGLCLPILYYSTIKMTERHTQHSSKYISIIQVQEGMARFAWKTMENKNTMVL